MGEYFHLKIFKSFTNHKRNESYQTIHLLIGTPTGCSVIDVIFPQGEEISEVRFKYVDSLCFVNDGMTDNCQVFTLLYLYVGIVTPPG